jgi:HTH-type transcriptional regulator/antitoxin HipB
MTAMSDIIRVASDIGPAVRRHRRSKRLKVTDVAARSGKSRDTIHRLERGEEVSVSTLMAVITTLGMSIEFVSAGLPSLEEMQARFAHLQDGTDDE